jgi:hypothetical protein
LLPRPSTAVGQVDSKSDNATSSLAFCFHQLESRRRHCLCACLVLIIPQRTQLSASYEDSSPFLAQITSARLQGREVKAHGNLRLANWLTVEENKTCRCQQATTISTTRHRLPNQSGSRRLHCFQRARPGFPSLVLVQKPFNMHTYESALSDRCVKRPLPRGSASATAV